MYKELRPVTGDRETASTPEMWAANFAASRRMTPTRRLRMRLTSEWFLVRRTLSRGGTVLDAGCGYGEWVQTLERSGYHAIGLDYSEELVSRLRRAYPSSTWMQADIRSIPLPGDSIDAVTSWGVIEHNEAGPHEALREFWRVIRPGGVVIVSVPRDSAVQRRASQTFFPPQEGTAFFQNFMSEEELGTHLGRAGFQRVETGLISTGSLALFSSALNQRLTGVRLRLATLAASILLKPWPRYHGMLYAVGRKP
jgi:SAM-dependent methyltransferase